MKILLVCAIMIYSNVCLAELFMIAGTAKNFTQQGSLLLSGCEKQCDALKVIKKHTKINLKEIRKGMKFTNSLGSDVCSLTYKAQSLLGQAQNRDRRAFCIFKDKSMVEMNSLTNHLTEHDLVQE